MEKIRILVVDDHPLFREGLVSILREIADFSVIEAASTGTQAIEMAHTLQPDVILMDIRLPDIDGIEATRRILVHSPQARILMLTMSEDNALLLRAMHAGAYGYLRKEVEKADMLLAIRAVGNGQVIFGSQIARSVIDFFSMQAAPDVSPHLFPELTAREREVLALIAKGYKNSQIARELSISGKTVANHISNIFSKMQVADRFQATRRLQSNGFS